MTIATKPDDIIGVFSDLLECSGIFVFDKNQNKSTNTNTEPCPWDRLSISLKELIISTRKLHTLTSAEQKCTRIATKSTEMDNDTTTTATINNTLLDVESALHQVREDAEFLSTSLPKRIVEQLKLCRKLESISRSDARLSNLFAMAKSLMGVIRHQKSLCLQSVQLIGTCIDNFYTQEFSDTIKILQNVYIRILRKCIDRNRSPWKEVVRFLTYYEEHSSATRCSSIPSKNGVFVLVPLPTITGSPSSYRFRPKSPSASSELHNIVEDFFVSDEAKKKKNGHDRRVLSVLIFGSEGSGKTFLLNEIKNKCLVLGVDVIDPVLPFDAIGTTVGAAEEIIISLICYAKINEGKCLLILDNIDSIIGRIESSESHQMARLRQLFYSLLEIINNRNYESKHGQLILICSSRENFGKDIDRFDEILQISRPNESERERMISKICDDHCSQPQYRPNDVSVESLVECTLGLSWAELAHYCQNAIISLRMKRKDGANTNDISTFLKHQLQSSKPESLKCGVNEDFVDMKVFSARDLQRMYPIYNQENPIADLPIYGESAKTAWKVLERLIILPVCRGQALNKILYHRCDGDGMGKKSFVGGALISAPPGSGKSTIAYFCAAFASCINHSVKLIDVSCTSLIHKEVGGSERAITRFFQIAKSASPCIVIMDGIENIAAVRGNDNTTEGTMDRVLSTLLTELDGVETGTSLENDLGSMAIIGITYDHTLIDPALLRPGRLERIVRLTNPDLNGRKQLISKELGGVAFKPDDTYPKMQKIDDLVSQLALQTDGHTGAEIISICNESKISTFHSLFEGGDVITNGYITPNIVFRAVSSRGNNSGRGKSSIVTN